MKITKIMNNTNLSKMIDNKYVLYFVFILSAIYLLGYLMSGNFSSIIFFVCFGFVTSLFSKNMTIILTVPLLLTSVLMIGEKVKESFANMVKKNLHKQVIETQTQINDMIANGVNTPQQKNALKIKNDKLKNLLKQIDVKPVMLKKSKVTVVSKPTVASIKPVNYKKK
jgi:competence protein ComGC